MPHLLNIIKDLHLAVITDDFEEFEKNSNYPLPVEILGSKDANGLNPLHKVKGPL